MYKKMTKRSRIDIRGNDFEISMLKHFLNSSPLPNVIVLLNAIKDNIPDDEKRLKVQQYTLSMEILSEMTHLNIVNGCVAAIIKRLKNAIFADQSYSAVKSSFKCIRG
jgi:protein tyrosine phosphatase